ncbi:YrhB domain-containing protein [Kitasatospora sp. NPDC048298]|uniref:YrhB domain-containing protein n=1 Tax=Kitasatospora sp. NPDC048298 TaxID=3364049 RepID=UPI0037167598
MSIAEAPAVELVESAPAQHPAGGRALVVCGVEEHALGWIVSANSAEFARTRGRRDTLTGGEPCLVDRQDGSVHQVPTTTFPLRQAKGIRPPAPLAAQDGAVAAMAHRHREARLPLARAYLPTVREGAEPPEELVDLTEEEVARPPLSIETVRPGRG